jgi:hypothetical protein
MCPANGRWRRTLRDCISPVGEPKSEINLPQSVQKQNPRCPPGGHLVVSKGTFPWESHHKIFCRAFIRSCRNVVRLKQHYRNTAQFQPLIVMSGHLGNYASPYAEELTEHDSVLCSVSNDDKLETYPRHWVERARLWPWWSLLFSCPACFPPNAVYRSICARRGLSLPSFTWLALTFCKRQENPNEWLIHEWHSNKISQQPIVRRLNRNQEELQTDRKQLKERLAVHL